MKQNIAIVNSPPKTADENEFKKKLNRAKSDLKRAQEKLNFLRECVVKQMSIKREVLDPEIRKYFLLRKQWIFLLKNALEQQNWSSEELNIIHINLLEEAQHIGNYLEDDEAITSLIQELVEMVDGDDEDYDDDWDEEAPKDFDFFQDASANGDGRSDPLNDLFKELQKDFEREEVEHVIKMFMKKFKMERHIFENCKTVEEVISVGTAYQRAKERTGAHHESQVPRANRPVQIRELYRKLASMIHPDKETDPTLKASKTELMQALNSAYRNNDIQALMEIQAKFVIDNPVDLLNTVEGVEAAIAHLKKEHKIIKNEIQHITANIKNTVGEGKFKKIEEFELLLNKAVRTELAALHMDFKRVEKDIASGFKSKKRLKLLVNEWSDESYFDSMYWFKIIYCTIKWRSLISLPTALMPLMLLITGVAWLCFY